MCDTNTAIQIMRSNKAVEHTFGYEGLVEEEGGRGNILKKACDRLDITLNIGYNTYSSKGCYEDRVRVGTL